MSQRKMTVQCNACFTDPSPWATEPDHAILIPSDVACSCLTGLRLDEERKLAASDQQRFNQVAQAFLQYLSRLDQTPLYADA